MPRGIYDRKKHKGSKPGRKAQAKSLFYSPNDGDLITREELERRINDSVDEEITVYEVVAVFEIERGPMKMIKKALKPDLD